MFQYNNSIVASGIMEDRIDTMEKGYNGYYLFKQSSINLLTTPISKEELKDVATEIKMKYFRKTNPHLTNIKYI